MKLTLIIIIFFVSGLFQNSFAQKYCVYESKTVNVLLKISQDGSQIIEISLTDNTKAKWIKYRISEKEVENSEPNSKRYTVSNGKLNIFYIDYFRYTDYIIVENLDNNEKLTLYKQNWQSNPFSILLNCIKILCTRISCLKKIRVLVNNIDILIFAFIFSSFKDF